MFGWGYESDNDSPDDDDGWEYPDDAYAGEDMCNCRRCLDKGRVRPFDECSGSDGDSDSEEEDVEEEEEGVSADDDDDVDRSEDDDDDEELDVNVFCVQIGTYHTHALDQVQITKNSISFTVPAVRTSPEECEESVKVTLEISDLMNVWAFWGSSNVDGAFFLLTTPDAAAKIRSSVRLSCCKAHGGDSSHYFSPGAEG
jgi:hypothetical protein